MAKDQSGLEFLAGILLGAGVGAAAALLLAPQSGHQTREVIRERGLEVKRRAEDVGEESRQRAKDVAEQARNRAREAQARAHLVIEKQGTRFQKAIGQSKEAYEEKREELKERL